MNNIRIGVVMVVQNEEETIERTVRSFYDHAERIVISIDPRRGYSGKSITPDNTIDIIRSVDKDNKIDILQGDFYGVGHPQILETKQRQLTADWLAARTPGLDWICQIDADEEFIDFHQVVEFLRKSPMWARGAMWQWVQVFNLLDDGRILVVTDHNGEIQMIPFFIAHRPFGRLVIHRNPAIVPFSLNRQTLRLNELLFRTNKVTKFIPVFDGKANLGGACLHYTFGKSESRIEEKLKTWSHATDFNTDEFFELWKRTKHKWDDVKDFHPLDGPVWPALKAMSYDELRAKMNAPIPNV